TALRIRQKKSVQGGGTWYIAQKSAYLHQIGDAASPHGIPGNACKVIGCQLFEDVTCLLFEIQLAVKESQARWPCRSRRIALDKALKNWLYLTQAPLLPAQRKHLHPKGSGRVLALQPPPKREGLVGHLFCCLPLALEQGQHGPHRRGLILVERLPELFSQLG